MPAGQRQVGAPASPPGAPSTRTRAARPCGVRSATTRPPACSPRKSPRRFERPPCSPASSSTSPAPSTISGAGCRFSFADTHDQHPHAPRQPRQHVREGPPAHLRRPDRHLERLQPGPGGRPDVRLEHELQDVHAQDRADQAERKRHAVTDRRLAVPRGLHRRLHRRRVRAGAGEQAGHHRVRHVHDRQLDEGHPERAEQRQPGRAGCNGGRPCRRGRRRTASRT